MNYEYLAHHGILGQKWGVRRFQNANGSYTSIGRSRHTRAERTGTSTVPSGKPTVKVKRTKSSNVTKAKETSKKRNSDENKEKRTNVSNEKMSHPRIKKAAKVGAVVAGTALAAYGGYKLAKHVQNKRSNAAMKKAEEYVSKNILNKIGETTYKNGTKAMYFESKLGEQITTKGARSNIGKAVGKRNAEVISKGRQIYKDATNTKLDRGLNKIVKTGDAVSDKARKAAVKAKNKVLDTVNPIYEYTPGKTSTVTKKIGNTSYTKTITELNKIRKYR